MKVLFTHSYFLHLDQKQSKSGKPYPPLAPLYAAAVLRNNGFTVAMADLQISSGPKEISKHLIDFSPEVLVIYDDSFNYLSKMCLTNMRSAVFEMQQIAKGFGIPVIVSSSDATDHLNLYLENGAATIIIGEAELSLLELLSAMESSQTNFDEIPGLAFFKEGKVHKTLARTLLREPDDLPQPAWDLIDFEKYRKIWLNRHGYFSINMVSTRGCPYKCNWCAKPIYGNRYTSHSAKRVVEDIAVLQQKEQITHVWFADDIFGLKPEFIQNFRNELRDRNIKISYKIQSRADLLLKENTVQLLAESGCTEVWLGAESGSQKILDAMDKGITIEEIETACRLLKAAGIKACLFLQFGYKGENMEDIHKTIAMLDRLMPDDIGVSISYPLPGTKFYDIVKSELAEKHNWRDSDDLDLMFFSEFSSDFYRYLQRYVHYRFRSAQSLQSLQKFRITKQMVKLPFYIYRKAFYKSKMSSALTS